MLACPLRTTLGPGDEVGLGAWVVVGAAPAEAPDGYINIAVAQDSTIVQDLHLGLSQGAMRSHAHFVLCCWDELLCWLPQWWWVA